MINFAKGMKRVGEAMSAAISAEMTAKALEEQERVPTE